MNTSPMIILGGGGHAKIVIDAARTQLVDIVALYDDNPMLHQTSILGIPVLGKLDDANRQKDSVSAHVAIGSNAARKLVAEKINCHWTTIHHSRACVSSQAIIGKGCFVGALAVVQVDATVGNHVIINTAAIVEHDAHIGSYVHIGPGACLAGNVSVGEGTLIGSHATVLPGIQMGSWCVVGAGAVVTRNILDGQRVAGVPAKLLEGAGR